MNLNIIWNFTFDVPDDRIATTELFFQLVLSSNSAFYEFGFPLKTRRPPDNNKQTWIKNWNKKVYLSNKSKTLKQIGGCIIQFQNVVIGKLSFIKFFYESVKHWKSRVENKCSFGNTHHQILPMAIHFIESYLRGHYRYITLKNFNYEMWQKN